MPKHIAQVVCFVQLFRRDKNETKVREIVFHPLFSVSSGSCERGTFPCGPIDDRRCVPQHLICSRSDACREDYRALCGLNYGSTDFIESIVNSSTDDINFCCKCYFIYKFSSGNGCCNPNLQLTALPWFPDDCFCLLGTGLLCGALNLTQIPPLPPEVSRIVRTLASNFVC